MALECSHGLMARNTEDNGSIIKHMGRGLSGTRMVTAMKENSRETNRMDMGFTHAQMERFTKGFGWMTSSMVKGKRNGLMAVSMLGTTRRDAETE